MSDYLPKSGDVFVVQAETEKDITGEVLPDASPDLYARDEAPTDLYRRFADITGAVDRPEDVLDDEPTESADPLNGVTRENSSARGEETQPEVAPHGGDGDDQPPVKPPTGGWPERSPDDDEPRDNRKATDHAAADAETDAFLDRDLSDEERLVGGALLIRQLYMHASQEEGGPLPDLETAVDFRDKIRDVVAEGGGNIVREMHVGTPDEVALKLTAAYEESPPSDNVAGAPSDERIVATLMMEVDVASSDPSQPRIPISTVEYCYTQQDTTASLERIVYTDGPGEDSPLLPFKLEVQDVTELVDEAARMIRQGRQGPAQERMEDVAESAHDHGARVPGELERTNPQVEPLPPTPITRGAQEQLQDWGLQPTQIQRLRELTSSLRYDLCPLKVARMAENDAYVHESPEGKTQVVLPDANGGMSDGRLDGECESLAVQFIQLVHADLEALNQDLASRGHPAIRPVFLRGNSPTHFNVKGASRHVWTGLLPENGNDVNAIVTIDSSFQEISMTADNGYEPYEAQILHDPHPYFDGHVAAMCVPTGTYREDAPITDWGSPFVLGISADRELIYSLSFLKDETNGEIRPAILAGRAEGVRDDCGVVTRSGDISFGPKDALTAAQRSEMSEMLSSLKKITIVRDEQKAQQLLVPHPRMYL